MGTGTWKGAAGTVVVVLSLIGVMATAGHYVFRPPVEEAIANGYGPGPAWHVEQLPRYDEHALATFLHIVPAFAFMLLAPLQLVGRVRTRFPAGTGSSAVYSSCCRW